MIGIRTFALPLAAVSALALTAPPALAAKFDGGWSMVAVTTRGHCGTIDIGLGVKRGRIYSTGGSFAFYPIKLGGRVSSSGHVSMRAVAGPRTANGTGWFRVSDGSGKWSGRGPSGLCSGTWSAMRS
jgi:hypothetical protein